MNVGVLSQHSSFHPSSPSIPSPVRSGVALRECPDPGAILGIYRVVRICFRLTNNESGCSSATHHHPSFPPLHGVKLNIDKECGENFKAYPCASNPGKFSPLPSRLIKLIDFSVAIPLSAQDDARQPHGLAERSISECQWVTVGKLAALRILNDQNTHLAVRARARPR